MQETVPPPPPPPRTHRFRTFVITLVLLGVAFLGGYVPQRIEAGRAKDELATLKVDYELSELHRRLGVAAQEAARNNYASAAEAARAFFAQSNEFLQKYPLENEPRTRTALTSYLGEKDALLAQLAAGNPVSRERIAAMFLAMDGVVTRRQ